MLRFLGCLQINPLAYWTFEDCFDFLNANNVPYHPLHDQGYPSIGDAKDTVPVDKSKWFDYAGERAGRFTGLANKVWHDPALACHVLPLSVETCTRQTCIFAKEAALCCAGRK